VGARHPEVVKDRIDAGNSQIGEFFFQFPEIGFYEFDPQPLLFDGVRVFTQDALAGLFEVGTVAVETDVGTSFRKAFYDFGGVSPETERGIDYRQWPVLL